MTPTVATGPAEARATANLPRARRDHHFLLPLHERRARDGAQPAGAIAGWRRKWVSEMKLPPAVKKPTVTRISPLVMPYISDHWTSNRSPRAGVAAEEDIGIPLPVTGRIGIHDRQRMAWAGGVVGGDLINRAHRCRRDSNLRVCQLVWSRLLPVSKVEFTQKLPDTSGATRATDKSSMIMTPVMGSGTAGDQGAAHLHRAGRHQHGPVALRKRRILDGAPPSGVRRAGGDKVGFSDDAVARHQRTARSGASPAPLMLYISNHWMIQRVAGAGIAAEGNVGVPLAVEIARIGINDRQRMI